MDVNWFTVYRAEKSHVDTTSQNDNIHTMKGKNVDWSWSFFSLNSCNFHVILMIFIMATFVYSYCKVVDQCLVENWVRSRVSEKKKTAWLLNKTNKWKRQNRRLVAFFCQKSVLFCQNFLSSGHLRLVRCVVVD